MDFKHHKTWLVGDGEPNLVSVIVPTYNSARFLLAAIDSVSFQTHRPLELIIVDDGSTDDTVEAVKEWSRGTSGGTSLTVRYIYQQNRGAAAARNRGLMESRGEYIQFLDSDDIFSRRKIALQVATLGRYGPYGATYGPWRLFCDDGDRIDIFAPHYGMDGEQWLKAWLSGWFVPPHSLLWRRADIQRLGPWDESLSAEEDAEYAMRYLALGGRLAYCRGAWAYYRRNPNFSARAPNVSRRRTGSSIRSRIRVARRFERLLAETGRLDNDYRRVLSNRYFEIAWDYTAQARLMRLVSLRDFRRLSPDGRAPARTFQRSLMVYLLGFTLTQKIQFFLLGVLGIPTKFPTGSVRTVDDLRVLDETLHVREK